MSSTSLSDSLQLSEWGELIALKSPSEATGSPSGAGKTRF